MSKKSLENFVKRTRKEAEQIKKDLQKFLLKTRFQLERDGKKNATDDFYQATTRSGNVRKYYKLTGRLRNSINARVKDGKNTELILQAGGFNGGQSVAYAAALEFGTPRFDPYLFLGRAVAKSGGTLPKQLEEFLKLQLQDLQ